MAVQYRYMSAEQQRTSAEGHAFAAEHSHLIATIDLAAAPNDPAKQARVAELEALVLAAHARVEAASAGNPLPEPTSEPIGVGDAIVGDIPPG